MSNPDHHDRLANSHIRVAGIWPIAGMTDHPPETFIDAADCTRLPPPFAELWSRYSGTDDDEILWEELLGEAIGYGIKGFFGVAHCPRFRATGGGGCSFSWGHYRYALFFAETIDALVDKMIAWGQSEWDEAIKAGGAK